MGPEDINRKTKNIEENKNARKSENQKLSRAELIENTKNKLQSFTSREKRNLDKRHSAGQVDRRKFLKIMGLGTGGVIAASAGIGQLTSENLLSKSYLTGMQTGAGMPSGGFTWDQTHADTSWLTQADQSGNLTVEKVTNLDSSGDGSLAAAISAAEDNENTVIVFEVGGVIDNGGETYLRTGDAENVYIAGETAPSPGITLIRGGIRVEASNVIVSHMTFLPGNDIGDPGSARSITVNGGTENVLFDHCTAGMAPDTNINFRDPSTNAAFINGINTEALNDSAHPEAPHGYALLIRAGSTGISYLGNLQTHNWKRNIKPNEDNEIVFANNYLFNWGERVWHGSDDSSEADMIGNVIEAGPDTTAVDSEGIFDANPGVVYWNDNTLIPEDTARNDDSIEYADSPMHLPSGLSEGDLVASSGLESALTPMVGPRPADRAPYEQRIISQFSNREGGIIDDQSDVGGYPDYQSTQRALNVPSSGILNWIRTNHTAAVENGDGTNTGGTTPSGGTGNGTDTNGTTTTPGGGTGAGGDPAELPEHTIELTSENDGEGRQYVFYTNGQVTKDDDHSAESPTDRVFTSKVVGVSAGGHDGYIIKGQITEFYAEDGITITYNGQEMTPSEFKETDVCNV